MEYEWDIPSGNDGHSELERSTIFKNGKSTVNGQDMNDSKISIG